MKILIIGDSNIRNCFVKDKFEKTLKATFSYEQAMSNETVKATLAKSRDAIFNVIFICTMLNEIAFATKGIKDDAGRDAEAKTVADTLREIVVGAAQASEETEFIIMKPLRRKIPAWIDKKTLTYHEMLGKDFSENAKLKNVMLVDSMEVPDNVLQPDGVHLSKDGLVNLQNHILESITKVITSEEDNMDMDDIFSGEIDATLNLLTNQKTPTQETASTSTGTQKQSTIRTRRQTKTSETTAAAQKNKNQLN